MELPHRAKLPDALTVESDYRPHLAQTTPPRSAPGNMTLTVVTNQRLDSFTLRQFGRQVHAALARSIQPFHTVVDGDALFALTTNEVEHPALSPIAHGVLAAEVAWDTVLSVVQERLPVTDVASRRQSLVALKRLSSLASSRAESAL